MATTPNFSTDETLDLWKVTRSANLWTNQMGILRKYPRYPICRRAFKQGVMENVPSGTNLTWQIILDDTGNAEFVTPYESVEYDTTDVIGTFSAPWVLLRHYHQITTDEINRNRASALRLQNLLKSKRDEAAGGAFNKLELRSWQLPTGSAEEKAKLPYGIPYTIVPITGAQVTANAATIAAGNAVNYFQGQNASGFSSWYGVDTSLAKYERVRSYCDVWDQSDGSITETGIDKILRLLRQIQWQGPISKAEFESGDFDTMAFHTTDAMMTNFERKARDNNESLGSDLGKFAGQANTKGVPYVWSPGLEATSASTNPLVAVNLNVIKPVTLAGEFFTEDSPIKLQNKPRVIATNIWSSYQWICGNNMNGNRRNLGRIDYVAAA